MSATSRTFKQGLGLLVILLGWSTAARADLGSQDMPGTAAQPDAPEGEEFLVEVRSANNNLPVLVVVGETAADAEPAAQLRKQLELTGLFSCPSTEAASLALPIDRKKWPRAATAVVAVKRQRRTDSSLTTIEAKTFHRAMPDEIRVRELMELPGFDSLNAATLADAVLEDVLGIRGHMSGQITFTDASHHGERTVRVMGPDGHRGRRISGFGVLARGSDFGAKGLVDYAAEDSAGKLSLFREGSTGVIALPQPGYLQSISYSPNSKYVVASIGKGNQVESWAGPDLNHLSLIAVPAGYSSLSPSVDDDGQVLHAVGPAKGPFTLHLGTRALTSSGVWAAMPSFCSTPIEKRIVYMVRSGSHWDLRITSLVNNSTRSVVMGGMSPSCSPDGRTVAFYSPGKARTGNGIYLVSDDGGTARKVWDGQAASLRWRGGEPLPTRRVERITSPDAVEPSDDEITTEPAVPSASP